MTKKDFILNAWAEVGVRIPKDEEHFLSKQGSLNYIHFNYYKWFDSYEDFKKALEPVGNLWWRPKSLRNIKSNSGWHKIEERKPKKDGTYEVCYYEEAHKSICVPDKTKLIPGIGHLENGKFQYINDYWDVTNEYTTYHITHWRVIKKKELPLY